MHAKADGEFIDTPLDADLLSTPFKIQTKWHVITGAPCSGKTTLVDLLADKGFRINMEAGRRFFERELAKGRTIDEIRQDPAAITCEIYDMMVNHERVLPPEELIFLDRALPDAFTFFRVADMNPNGILLDCFEYRYTSVFMLERLPYERDGVRDADDQIAAYHESWMLRDYSALGYDVIRVPVLPPVERLAFVLESLSARYGIQIDHRE
jgi:predicted ATPase